MKQTFAAMNHDDFSVSTIAFDDCDRELIDQVSESGIQVYRLPNRKKDSRAYMAKFHLLLTEQQYDVVHVCGNSAIMAFELYEAKRSGVGMRIAHSHNTMCTHRIADKLLRPFFYHLATDYYACGEDAGKWLFGNRKFTLIPNGKNLKTYAFSKLTRVKKRLELGFSDKDIVIGHVGRFNNQKNHKKIIEIFSDLHSRSNHYRLCLIGDGELFDSIRKRVNELGLSDFVSFLGRRSDVPQLLNAMDCMVLPSLYEGFPNVVLEWQLNGLPLVMSDTITDECAITSFVYQVPPTTSTSAWIKAIEDSMTNRNRFIDSNCARKEAKERGFDIYENAAALRELYFKGLER